MKYASEGSLRQNLQTIAQTDWKDKLNLLQCIASDLQIIHSHDLVHRDLHSGNILLNSHKSAYITDLGLLITTKSKSDGIFGILPYIAPEVWEKQQYTEASDIYSFGMIMWEILNGKPVPFEETSKLQSKLQYKIQQICDGLRLPIHENTATCYADLIKKCWNAEPEKRPTAKEICNILAEWQNDETILSELSESDEKLQNIKNEDTGTQIYNDSHYKSSFIPPNTYYKGNYIYTVVSYSLYHYIISL
ncbi:kinase-like domain-containing protein [Gigaspora rosea]|uniref:Kinase-like domain-containing protein n=1 Tax=Gigaspora rosea TaxID=44941 RepID=A0A397W4M4_9GLOM|nr:kinase-like domain-containing protein [Gigaspora rosea]